MNRKIILLFGDTHAGSEYGLSHPETILEKEDEIGNIIEYNPNLNEIQKFLFHKVYRPGIEQVMKFAGKDEVIAIHNGDATQGNKYEPSPISNQILIAVQNMKEVLQYDNVKTFRMLKSTPSHAFGDDSDSDILISTILRKTYPDKNIATHYHGDYLLEDVDILADIAHHGPSKGVRKWLEGNQFMYYIRDIMLRRLLKGKRTPDIIVRSHTHGKLETHLTIEDHRVWGFILPPMQFPSGFVRQITRSIEEVEMGMLMVEVIQYSENRKTVYPYWITKKLDITTQEIL